MLVFLYLGPAAAVVGLIVALFYASNGRRYGVVLLLGLALAAAWFAVLLLTANTDPNHPDCSDCSYTWGRWWEPALVVLILGLNVVGWMLGATGGRLIRMMRARTRL